MLFVSDTGMFPDSAQGRVSHIVSDVLGTDMETHHLAVMAGGYGLDREESLIHGRTYVLPGRRRAQARWIRTRRSLRKNFHICQPTYSVF